MLRTLVCCMFSPRLFKVYRQGDREEIYQAQSLEKWADMVINSAHTLLNVSFYTSPLICMYIYKKSFGLEDFRVLSNYVTSITCLIALSFLVRAIGRASNPNYVQFLSAFEANYGNEKVKLNEIRKYDFEFHAWPITYTVPDGYKPSTWVNRGRSAGNENDALPMYQRIPIRALAFVATHTFGLRLIYPGSLGFLQNLMKTAIIQGRTQLVEVYGGKRAKVRTADGNDIDTMFVDNRGNAINGNKLVICCEGNSGFYEVGIMISPIKCTYSALGWNHPGFGGSTGLPYPTQEKNAIEAILMYATHELGFDTENIVLYGWSIGAYSATWGALQYQNIRALILDATFDDLLPLAVNHMPASWAALVTEVVRSHVDLNISEMLRKYHGRIFLVRRTEDEIICLRQGMLASNRGNALLRNLLEMRHPDDVGDVEQFRFVYNKYIAMTDAQRASLQFDTIGARDLRILKLIKRYMRDYKSTHCIPLPEQFFEEVVNSINENNLASK